MKLKITSLSTKHLLIDFYIYTSYLEVATKKQKIVFV